VLEIGNKIIRLLSVSLIYILTFLWFFNKI